MTTEAAAADATRAKKAAVRISQASAHRMVASAGAGGGGRGPRVPAVAAPALKFNLKMVGVAPTSGALFAKKPSAPATTASSTKVVKAPFAMAIGAKQSGGKERDKPKGMSFKGFSMPKLSQPKPKAVDASAPQAKEKTTAQTKEKNVASFGAKPIIAASAKKSLSLSSGAVVPAATQNRFMTRPSGTNAKAPLFQLKPPTAPTKPPATTTKEPLIETKTAAVVQEGEIVPTASVVADVKSNQLRSPPPVVKKRSEPPDSAQASESRKKIKIGTPSKPANEKTSSVPRALRVLNVVSPEPRRVLLHTPKKKANASPMAVGATSVAEQNPEQVEVATLSDRGLEMSELSGDGGSSSELVTAIRRSSPVFGVEAAYSFVTKEEEDLVTLPSEDKAALAAEEDAFVHDVRSIQAFVDEVANNHHTTTSHLLASHATISECLLDMLTDISALAGGLQLLELNKITAKSLEDFDASALPNTIP